MRASMRVARWLAFCCVAAIAAPASARVTLQFTGALSLGWTDNVLNAPIPRSGSPFPAQTPFADFFGDLRPQLVLTTGSPRAVQALTYAFSYTYFFRNASSNAYSNTLTWSGAFLPSKRTQLLLTLAAAQSELTTQSFAAQTTDPATPTGSTLFRPGRVNTASISLREQLSIDATPRLRVGQSLSVSGTIPISPRTLATNISTDFGLTADYLWRKTSLGAVLRVNHFYSFEVDGTDAMGMPTVLVASQGFFTNSALARWRQDFGHFWSSELGLGVQHTVAQNGTGNNVGPAANAALRFARPEAAASLTYAHATQPSPLLAQLFLSDSVSASVAAPLGLETKVSLVLSAVYSYSRQVLADGKEGARGHLVTADVALNYAPIQGLAIYLRGQTSFQRGFDEDPNPLPSVRRSAIMLGISGFYPTSAAAIVPRALGTRVDGSDRQLIAEPHMAPRSDGK